MALLLTEWQCLYFFLWKFDENIFIRYGTGGRYQIKENFNLYKSYFQKLSFKSQFNKLLKKEFLIFTCNLMATDNTATLWVGSTQNAIALFWMDWNGLYLNVVELEFWSTWTDYLPLQLQQTLTLTSLCFKIAPIKKAPCIVDGIHSTNCVKGNCEKNSLQILQYP